MDRKEMAVFVTGTVRPIAKSRATCLLRGRAVSYQSWK